MSLRNLVVILLTSVFSLVCYEKVQWNRKAATLSEAMTLIERIYLEEVEPRSLFDAAMRGMVGILDVNSGYLEPSEYQPFHEGLNQKFGGIGVLVEFNTMTKRPTVVLSCSMLSDLLGKRLPEGMPVEWMDIKLHNTPKKLAAALQALTSELRGAL